VTVHLLLELMMCALVRAGAPNGQDCGWLKDVYKKGRAGVAPLWLLALWRLLPLLPWSLAVSTTQRLDERLRWWGVCPHAVETLFVLLCDRQCLVDQRGKLTTPPC